MTDLRSRSDALGELDPAARRRVRIGALIAALLTAAVVAVTPLIPPLGSLRDTGQPAAPGLPLSQPLFDFFQRVSSGRISKDVQLVTIDEQSLAVFGGWPWSRFDMRELVARIAEQHPAAIGFDVLFPEPDRMTPALLAEYFPDLPASSLKVLRGLPGGDEVFGAVLGRTPSVLARAGSPWDQSNVAVPPAAQFIGVAPASLPTYPKVLANVQAIEGRGAGHGLANSPKDRDGIVRSIPLMARAGGYLTPSLALEIVRVAEGEPPIRLEGDAHGLREVLIGRHRIPTTPSGQLRMRFLDVMQDQVTSPVEIRSQTVAPHQFTGKIVLIGLTSAAAIDVVGTARDPQTFGVYVQAQAIDAILHSRVLVRPPWVIWAEWLAGLLLVASAAVFVPRLRLTASAMLAVGIMAAALGGSWFAFQAGVLFDPAPVVAPAVVAALTMISLLFVEGGRVRARLRSFLELERLERKAASQIQTGMLIARADLQAITPRVEIDAVLEPALAVGGDLYDVFLLDTERLCFVVGDVTGKGLPASLFMALAKALSRSLLMQPHKDLAQALGGINAELSPDNGQNMQLSLLVGVLHLADGRLELCSAGHENPVILDVAGGVRALRLDGGPPLCAIDDFPYPLETDHLGPGETLIVFTDGVTEAQDPGQALFGSQRTRAAVAKAAEAASLSGLVDALVATVRGFEAGGEPSDDLTVLALRRPAA
ncbi:CHASE2 domain-containing protein [Phenylobacterium sp.]|uniref:CHASE2 domain-containing protein n=1 Tax=Phenylobacterium sp. TaxID=1871053 RepID=UPI0025CC9AF5|nr:CHASE2 domain-containing protein [Phenylobacterium sp.]